MSDHSARPLRHALKQVAVPAAAGSLLLSTAVVGLNVPAPASAAASAPTVAAPAAVAAPAPAQAQAGAAAPVRLRAVPAAAHLKKKRVNVKAEMRTAASLKGRPYRYGASGPRAFDCSGYTQYVLKRQGIKLNRTAAAQYRQTRHLSKKSARAGDLVFFYGSGGIYHVGIYAGKGRMWAAPHSGSHVRLQKIYGSNWRIGRLA